MSTASTGPRFVDAAERLAQYIIDNDNKCKARGEEPHTAVLIAQAIREAVKDVVGRFQPSGISDDVKYVYGIREGE